MRATHAGASTVSEPLLRPNRPEVSRHPAVERGCAVIEEPVTPKELNRRLTGLLGSPRNDAGAEPRPDGKDRLIPREDEVLAISPQPAPKQLRRRESHA
jgi:hypothetical protein